MSEIKNGRFGLCGAEHSKCDRMVTLGFNGLRPRNRGEHMSQSCERAMLTKRSPYLNLPDQ